MKKILESFFVLSLFLIVMILSQPFFRWFYGDLENLTIRNISLILGGVMLVISIAMMLFKYKRTSMFYTIWNGIATGLFVLAYMAHLESFPTWEQFLWILLIPLGIFVGGTMLLSVTRQSTLLLWLVSLEIVASLTFTIYLWITKDHAVYSQVFFGGLMSDVYLCGVLLLSDTTKKRHEQLQAMTFGSIVIALLVVALIFGQGDFTPDFSGTGERVRVKSPHQKQPNPIFPLGE
ncbi:MAG: hypothetical protein PHP32_02985 [Candidatus Izemoplasmatales bacterium]|nr:hypothetical protein [Candidatus Izemoplasmatales bacterium]